MTSAVSTGLASRPEAAGGRDERVEPPRAATMGRVVGLYVASVVVALVITALLVLVVGHSPWSVFSALWTGSVSTPGAVGQTLDDTLPVLLVAIGTLVSVRAGMFSIGQTGQLLMGATAAAFVTLKPHGPGAPILLLALVSSAVGGAVWAGLAALLRVWRRIDVVISTLLLIYVADQLLAWLVSDQKLLEEPPPVGGLTGALPQSALLPSAVRLPRLFGQYPAFGVSLAVVIVAGLFVLVWVLLSRTRWGVHIRMVGANAVAARRFGVRVAAVAAGALVLCGALSGLAGGVMLTGEVFRIQAGFDNNFGNDGLLAALVARDRPAALVPVAFLFAMIRTGGNFLLATGVPEYLAQVLEGLLVLAFVFPPAYLERREWARRLKAARHLALRSTA